MNSFSNLAKKKLRKSIQEKTMRLQPEEIKKQSRDIKQKLLSSTLYKNSQRVCIYLSTPTEVDTIGILEEMFKLDKKIFVPAYEGEFMKMLKIKDIRDYDSLPMTKWNIKQPNFSDNRENGFFSKLDLIVIPGVAFSLKGGRLGHGMGYYDKFLKNYFNKYSKNHHTKLLQDLNSCHDLRDKTIIIGLAFKEQIIEDYELPMEEHDFRLNYICSGY